MPWINSRYYMNPFYGRALEKARVASEGGVWSEELPESVQQRPIGKPVQEIDFWDDDGRLSSSARLPAGDEDFWEDEPSSGTRRQNSSARWVTIDHRHVLIDQARVQEIRARIAEAAKKYAGSTAWAYAKRKDNFPPDTNKCNKFVYDAAKEGGAELTVIGSDGKPRPPLAGEWADPRAKIAGWRALGPNETPQPGDVAAYKLPGHATYTGHSGIVTDVDADGTVHAIAAHADVVGPDSKFQRVQGVTFRRYTGGR